MSRPSTDELTRAIELANLDDVKRLMADGANPYENNSNGQSALEVWQVSQKQGNPYAVEMGQALLERRPASPQEEAVFYQTQDRQMANLARALGVSEHCKQVGINPQSAYIPPQTLESSKACWAAVCQAQEAFGSAPPMVEKVEFSRHFLLGLEEGRQCVVRANGSDAANLRDNGGKPVRVHQEAVWDFSRRLGKTLPEEFVCLSSQGTLRAIGTEGPEFQVTARGLQQTGGLDARQAQGKTDDWLGDMACKAIQTLSSWRKGRQPEQAEPSNSKRPHP